MSQERVPEYENMNDPPIQDQPEFQEFLRTLKTNIEYLKAQTTSVAFTIGTVSTGAPSDATITGTFPNFVLNLTLEQGDPGADGATGPAGPAGANGADGPGPGGISGDAQVNNGIGGFDGITGWGGSFVVSTPTGTLSITVDRGIVTSVI